MSRELLLAFLGVFLLLFVVGLGGRFIGFLQQAAAGRFSAEVLMLLLALRAPEFIQVVAPFAFALAVLLTFGRLHAEREFVALTNAGVTPGRLVGWTLAAGAPVVVLVAVLSLEVVPDARRAYAELSDEQLADSELAGIVPGVFHLFSDGRRVTYARDVDRAAGRLEGIFMAERRGETTVTMWAESGRVRRLPETGARYLELEDGVRYEGRAGDAAFRVVEFEKLGQRLERDLPPVLADARRTSTAGLDLADRADMAELQWRLALPVMTLIGALAVLGVARPGIRAGRFARVMPGLGVAVGYFLLLVFAQNGVASGALPAVAGLWVVHGAFLAFAIWRLRRGTRPA